MAVAVAQPLRFNERHTEKLLHGLNRERFETENLCDATLQVEDKTFNIHKCIVGKVSFFLRKLFKVEMKEKYDSFANMKGLTSKVMETILTYIYTGSVDVNDDNVFDVLSASEYLLIDELKLRCRDYLMKNVCADNCVKYNEIGKHYEWVLLERKATDVFIKNFAEVITQDEFASLKYDDLKHFLSRVDQDSSSFRVMNVYEGIISWVKYDLNQRKKYFSKLLKFVKFHLLSIANLKRILKDELVKEFPFTVKLLNEEISWKRHLIAETKSKKNLFAAVSRTSVRLFECFSEAWRTLPNLPNDGSGACVVSYYDHLYVIGGAHDNQLIQRLNLNGENPVWENAGQTLRCRNNAQAIVDNDMIVISGGEGEQSVEIYRKVGVEVHQEQLQPMNHARSKHAMVKCSGSIYCFGGCDKTLTEVYINRDWKVVNKEERFKKCHAISVDDEIFLLDNTGQLLAFNVDLNEWEDKSPCSIEYKDYAASYRNGIIYVFGTFINKNRRCYEYILREYDTEQDNWNVVSSSTWAGLPSLIKAI